MLDWVIEQPASGGPADQADGTKPSRLKGRTVGVETGGSSREWFRVSLLMVHGLLSRFVRMMKGACGEVSASSTRSASPLLSSVLARMRASRKR
jgi:hypothetical protein